MLKLKKLDVEIHDKPFVGQDYGGQGLRLILSDYDAGVSVAVVLTVQQADEFLCEFVKERAKALDKNIQFSAALTALLESAKAELADLERVGETQGTSDE